MVRRPAQAVLVLSLVALALNAQQSGPAAGAVLHDVKAVQVEPTVVSNPGKVKDPSAAGVVEDSLKDAFRQADIQVADEAPVRAHLVLEEFSSGSMAKRMTVGFGTGRSSIECRLVLQDASGKELSSVPIDVRGNKAFNGYEGNGTQRKQAVSSLEKKLTEQLEKMK